MWTRWECCACALVAVVTSSMLSIGCKSDGSTSSVPDASDPGGGTPDAPTGGTAVMLPVTVSDYFVPSGYMGDGETPTAITVETMTCRQPRPPAATGDCYRFRYMPGAKAWAGVYWQYPERNWGTSPGKQIEAGATKVTFYAAGVTGREKLDFIAGGEIDPHFPYRDSFKATKTITLTTTLTKYELDIAGRTYDSGVLGAFAWAVGVPLGSTTPVEFYLDTIRWEK